MLNELLEKLGSITAEAEAMLQSAANATDVENAKNKLTGRNGSLTALAPRMGKIAKEDKPQAGKAFNDAKNAVQSMIERHGNVSAAVRFPRKRSTSPSRTRWKIGHKHPVSQTIDDAARFSAEWGSRVAAGPEIETVANA